MHTSSCTRALCLVREIESISKLFGAVEPERVDLRRSNGRRDVLTFAVGGDAVSGQDRPNTKNLPVDLVKQRERG